MAKAKKELSIIKRLQITYSAMAAAFLMSGIGDFLPDHSVLGLILSAVGLVMATVGLVSILRKHESDDEMSIMHKADAGVEAFWILATMLLITLAVSSFDSINVWCSTHWRGIVYFELAAVLIIYAIRFTKFEKAVD